ncbi:MAG TPA: glycoside hydrolase domain-containing protein [Trebonia sp.]|nr:glycoside hydrolase domain-containing protein [Trebonia sp.]
MRGAVALIIGGGLLLGGTLPASDRALAQPAGPAPGPAGPASTGGTGSTTGTRAVVYDGYEVSVPASWPVYRLDQEPQQCVRYDRHAVYLGVPAANQHCPAWLIGRTETVSIVPSATDGPSAGTELFSSSAETLSRPQGVVMQDSSDQVLQVMPVADKSVTVTATYGSDLPLAKQLLATLRPAPPGAAWTPASPVPASSGSTSSGPGSSGPGSSLPASPGSAPASPVEATSASPVTTAPAGAVPAGAVPAGAVPASTGSQNAGPASMLAAAPAPGGSVAAAVSVPPVSGAGFTQAPPQGGPGELKVSASPPGTPTPWPTQVARRAPKRAKRNIRPEFGFDTCAVPSQAALRAWRRRFAVVAVYIGGVNAACYHGNLTASWIHRAVHLGWSMLPTYVGPQAPCYGYGMLIRPGAAASEGRAAAQNAAWDAWRLGLPAGSPIYYDMEAYSWRSKSCTTAVIDFLGAWTREINAKGYTSGVYSSMDACIWDLQWSPLARRSSYRPPQALWYAMWDGRYEVNDGRLRWPHGQRSKQYIGPHNLNVGGITLNIDTDYVDGPTAR